MKTNHSSINLWLHYWLGGPYNTHTR